MNFLTSWPCIQEAESGILHSRTLGNSRRMQEGPSGFWRAEHVGTDKFHLSLRGQEKA